MRNREAIRKKVEGIDSNLNRMKFNINHGDRDECYATLDLIREQLDQVKLYIESEPTTGNELNNI